MERMSLSPRQNQVVACVSVGLQDKEIAEHLGISLGTTKAHLQSAMDRLNLHSRVQLAVWFVCQKKGIDAVSLRKELLIAA